MKFNFRYEQGAFSSFPPRPYCHGLLSQPSRTFTLLLSNQLLGLLRLLGAFPIRKPTIKISPISTPPTGLLAIKLLMTTIKTSTLLSPITTSPNAPLTLLSSEAQIPNALHVMTPLQSLIFTKRTAFHVQPAPNSTPAPTSAKRLKPPHQPASAPRITFGTKPKNHAIAQKHSQSTWAANVSNALNHLYGIPPKEPAN